MWKKREASVDPKERADLLDKIQRILIADYDFVPEREEIVLSGEMPSAPNPPRGCRFHPRCPMAMPRCGEAEPALR